MRLFVAVPLAAGSTRAWDGLWPRLAAGAWRPVAAANRHLTLRFLGERPAGEVPPLQSALGGALAGARALSVEMRGLGVFPARGRAAVLWVGCGDGASALAALAARVEEACRAAGLPAADRPFAAHLTLARRRGRGAGDGGAAALARSQRDTRWGVMDIDRVSLLRSELLPGGPRYTPISEWMLARRGGGDIP